MAASETFLLTRSEVSADPNAHLRKGDEIFFAPSLKKKALVLDKKASDLLSKKLEFLFNAISQQVDNALRVGETYEIISNFKTLIGPSLLSYTDPFEKITKEPSSLDESSLAKSGYSVSQPIGGTDAPVHQTVLASRITDNFRVIFIRQYNTTNSVFLADATGGVLMPTVRLIDAKAAKRIVKNGLSRHIGNIDTNKCDNWTEDYHHIYKVLKQNNYETFNFRIVDDTDAEQLAQSQFIEAMKRGPCSIERKLFETKRLLWLQRYVL